MKKQILVVFFVFMSIVINSPVCSGQAGNEIDTGNESQYSKTINTSVDLDELKNRSLPSNDSSFKDVSSGRIDIIIKVNGSSEIAGHIDLAIQGVQLLLEVYAIEDTVEEYLIDTSINYLMYSLSLNESLEDCIRYGLNMILLIARNDELFMATVDILIYNFVDGGYTLLMDSCIPHIEDTLGGLTCSSFVALPVSFIGFSYNGALKRKRKK